MHDRVATGTSDLRPKLSDAPRMSAIVVFELNMFNSVNLKKGPIYRCFMVLFKNKSLARNLQLLTRDVNPL